MAGNGGKSKSLILTAMIFAVSMTFIDQTIVSIAVPEIQRELGLSATGVQWAVNAYLLSLAAFFAYGGRLADTVGHRKIAVTRRGHLRRRIDDVRAHAEGEPGRGLDHHLPGGPGRSAARCSSRRPWPSWSRPSRSGSGARRWPCSSGSPAASPPSARSSAATSPSGRGGPSSGSTSPWPSSPSCSSPSPGRPPTHQPARMDYRGLALIVAGIGLSVFGFQQAAEWGWSNPGIGLCIAAGVLLLVVFVLRRAAHRVAVDAGPDLPDPAVPGREHGARHRHAGLRARSSSSPASTPRSPWPRRRRSPGCSS